MIKHIKMLLLVSVITGCASSEYNAIKGSVIKQGIIEAFPLGLLDIYGRVATFEPSSAYVQSGYVFLVNDRPQPVGYPSQMLKLKQSNFAHEVIKQDSIQFVESQKLSSAFKIESVTKSYDGDSIFAATSFSFLSDEKTELDPYNTILSWPVGKSEDARILNESERNGTKSSRYVHTLIRQALMDDEYPLGPGFFKIEGLTSVPGNKLVFGLRKYGKSSKESLARFVLLEAILLKQNGEYRIDSMRKAYSYDVANNRSLNYPVGISSIEYDQSRNGLFILTSYEAGDFMGGYLWFLPLNYYQENKPPKIVLDSYGAPLHFAHKAEGLAMLNDHELLIIHDDDRRESIVTMENSSVVRKVNQGIFSRVKIEQAD
jgi:hypothetical protein